MNASKILKVFFILASGGLYILFGLVVYGIFGLVGVAVLGAITIILINRDISKNPPMNKGTGNNNDNNNRRSKTGGMAAPAGRKSL